MTGSRHGPGSACERVRERAFVFDVETFDLSPADARRRQEGGALLLDVREPYEWAAFHAPGALNVPLGQLASRKAEVPTDRDVLVICASGNRSQVATSMLRRGGTPRAFNVEGGMMGWMAAGLPVEAPKDAEPERSVEVRAIRTPGLGDTTYLLVHEGVGLVVDPQRDVERFLDAADEAGAKVRFVLETHLHNDYVSGGRELARRASAELVLPAGAGVAFDHSPAFHLEDLEGDGLVVRPIHTPGHTPEHLSYLVFAGGQAVALFSGGSLLVGSAGRPDLLGPERTRQLALAQHRSIQRLATLPDELELFPTHGEGSFCASSGSGRTTSTIGAEKRSNRLLGFRDPEAFVQAQLAGLQPYPRYYALMGGINTLGPRPLASRTVPELSAEAVRALGDTVHVVDARPRDTFAAGHIAGALGVELEDQFGTWVGWLLPFDAPIVLVLDDGQDLEEAVVQLGRIGFDEVRGVLRGVASWEKAGFPMERYETVDVEAFARAVDDGSASQVLDVRSPGEWETGSLPGATHGYVPDLLEGLPGGLDPTQPVWLACASGFRASIAASLLERHGARPVVLVEGGVPDVERRIRN